MRLEAKQRATQNSTSYSRKIVESIETSILLEGYRRVLELVTPRGVLESLSKSQDARIVRNATEKLRGLRLFLPMARFFLRANDTMQFRQIVFCTISQIVRKTK